MEKIIGLLDKYYMVYLQGLWGTLWISAVTVLCGTLLGLLIAAFRMSRSKILNSFASAYIEVLRGTPILLQLYFFWIGLPKLLPFELSDTMCIVVALVINASAYISEIIRGSLLSLDQTQLDAARAVGFTRRQAVVHVILPQLVARTLPALTGQFASIIKDSSLLSLIAVIELTQTMREISAANFRLFECYLVLGLLYLCLTLPVSFISERLERRFRYEA